MFVYLSNVNNWFISLFHDSICGLVLLILHLWMKNLCDDLDKQNDPYETLSTMMTPNSRNFQNGQVGSRVSHLTSGGSNSSNSEEINQSRWHHVTPVVTAAR